jgi:hypothetical protein
VRKKLLTRVKWFYSTTSAEKNLNFARDLDPRHRDLAALDLFCLF